MGGYRTVVCGMLLGLLFGLGGCAVEQGKVYVKDGQRYGVTSGQIWRGRWWNYYERGSSYAAGGFWEEAIGDLQAAIKQRHDDQRRARTYGLHFLDYFPHRDLGIVYYQQGRYADAVQELDTSLRQVDTAKAKFYLNKARQKDLERTQRDVSPPRIVVETPPDGLLTRQFAITVTGRVEDDAYVAAITVNGQAQFIELAAPQWAFRQDVSLQDGLNTLDITAVDLVGRLSRRQVTVTLDRQGPLLSLDLSTAAGPSPQQRLRLTGVLSDSSGVMRFVLAGRELPVPPGTAWEFQEDVSLPADTSALPFAAEDAAGNVTRGIIPLASPTGKPAGTRQGWLELPALPRWASLTPGLTVTDIVTASPAVLPMAQSMGQAPPVITLNNLGDEQTTYYDTVYLEGRVVASSPITALTLNGVSLLRSPRQQIHWSYQAALQPGDNRFVVVATDKTGHTAQREIVVHRHIAEVKRQTARLRLTLLPLEKKGQVTPLAEAMDDNLVTAFVDQGRFQLVERQQLQAILQEQRLSQTPLVEPETAAKIGKILAAEGMLIGTVTETSQAVEMFARFVDVESAEIMAAIDVYGEDLEPRALRLLAEGLAWKLRQRFPLVEGVVLKRDGQQVFVDLNSKHALQKHMKAILFRDGPALLHPLTGKPLGNPAAVLGEARIEAVYEEFSQATILQSLPTAEIQQLDKVITK